MQFPSVIVTIINSKVNFIFFLSKFNKKNISDNWLGNILVVALGSFLNRLL
jgi:hypothetical protein